MKVLNLFLALVMFSVIGMIYLQTAQKREAYVDQSPFELIHPSKLAVIQGLSSTFPNKALVFEEDPSKPSVDGTTQAPKSMFTFAFNKASPECCGTDNSTGYSSSGGCICITDKQKEYFTKNSQVANIGCMA